jgi:hypothetical protein
MQRIQRGPALRHPPRPDNGLWKLNVAFCLAVVNNPVKPGIPIKSNTTLDASQKNYH